MAGPRILRGLRAPGWRSQRIFDGAEALAFTGRAVALGPRPDGFARYRKLRTYIGNNWPREAAK